MRDDLAAVRNLLNSNAGQVLKRYLEDNLQSLNDISAIAEKGTPTEQAIEVKAQKRAYLKLQEIYKKIMDLSTEVKVKDERDNYHSI